MDKEKLLGQLKNKWETRSEDLVSAAEIVASLCAKSGCSIHWLSQFIGARETEIAAFIDFSHLCRNAQEFFCRYDLPITLAIDLIDEEEKLQVQILSKLCENLPKAPNLIDRFECILQEVHEAECSWQEALTGNHLKHLASKAKSYSVLNSRKRRALFDFGKKKSWGRKFSEKQKNYLHTILDELKQEGILTGDCSEKNCNICEEISSIMKGN